MSHRRPWREDPDVYADGDNLAGWVAFGVLVVALAAILCGLSGCAAHGAGVSDPTNYGNAVTRIEMRAAQGADVVAKAPAFNVDVVRQTLVAIFDGIKADATEERKNLITSAADVAEARNAVVEKDREISRLNQALKDERGHWIGYQLRLWGKIIAGVGVALWLASGVVSAYLPTGWAGTLIHALPLANPFAWLRDRILKPGPAAAGA